MSPDSWENNLIIIVTIVFPNIWQLWIISVIVVAGRERCSVFLLLNKGRGYQNVSQSSANHYSDKSRVFGEVTLIFNVILRSRLPLKQPQNASQYTKQTNWKFPFNWSTVRCPRRILWSLHVGPSLSAPHMKNSCDQSTMIIWEMCLLQGHFHLGLGFFWNSSQMSKKCHSFETVRGLTDWHALSVSTCRLKMPLTSHARCTGDHSPSKEISATWAMQCIVFYPDSRQTEPKVLWRTITDTWNVSMAPAVGQALAKKLLCVWKCVPGRWTSVVPQQEVRKS